MAIETTDAVSELTRHRKQKQKDRQGFKLLCHKAATRAQEAERSDPHVYNRVMSELTQGTATFADYPAS